MKNKKGFTLVELLAVIVILALIMGIAVVSIGNVLQTSKEQIMFENAQSIIDGAKKHFAIKIESPEGKNYGFGKAFLSQGGTKSPLGGDFVFRTMGNNESGDKEVTTGLWKLGTAPGTCAANVASYIAVSATGEYSICLTAGAGEKYLSCTESKVSEQKVADCIHDPE